MLHPEDTRHENIISMGSLESQKSRLRLRMDAHNTVQNYTDRAKGEAYQDKMPSPST